MSRRLSLLLVIIGIVIAVALVALSLSINPTTLIETIGIAGVIAIIFAENGLFFGFFLPGDSLLFTAGFLASQGYANIWVLGATCLLAAILGVSVGYAFGARWGRRIFHRPNSRFFKQEYLAKAEDFYHRHGSKTIVLARFVPIVRTFAPIVAGVGNMRYRTFLLYNIIGGLVWVGGLVGAGFWLGEKVKNVDKYLLPIIAIIIFLSIFPGVVQLLRTPARRQTVRDHLRHLLRRPKS